MPPSPDYWQLPVDFIDFVRQRNELDYDRSACEAGTVTLKPLDALQLIEIYISSEDTDYEPCLPPEEDDVYDYNEESWDPRCGEGYYAVQAVSLLNTDPERPLLGDSVLLWYPYYQKFGQWDRQHSNAIRFRNSTWRDIVEQPLRFLNAMWRWDSSDPYMEMITPWLESDFDFRPFSDDPEAEDWSTPVSPQVIASEGNSNNSQL